MDKLQMQQFITELTGSVMNDLIKESSKYPEEWDGIELRWRIADVFSQVVIGDIGDRKGKRYREYKNTVLVENLI